MRPTMVVSVLLVAACMPAARPVPSEVREAPTVSPAPAASVRLADFEIVLPERSMRAGSVSYTVTNDGPTIHNLSLRDSSGRVVLKSADLEPGRSQALSGRLEAGRYVAFCSLPGHESLGMRVELVAEAGPG